MGLLYLDFIERGVNKRLRVMKHIQCLKWVLPSYLDIVLSDQDLARV